ncbi:hypothetical protein AB0O61_17850 [Streptomyces bungoensis]
MATIRHMTYQPAERGASSVEVMTFQRLRDINDRGTQRADFHVLALVDEGDGTVTVDFVSHPLSARTAVWIPPGAVHRWDDITRVAGHLVLFVPTAPVTHRTRELVASPDLVARWPVPAEAWPFADAARRHLVLEAAALAEDPSTELPAILLSARSPASSPRIPRRARRTRRSSCSARASRRISGPTTTPVTTRLRSGSPRAP